MSVDNIVLECTYWYVRFEEPFTVSISNQLGVFSWYIVSIPYLMSIPQYLKQTVGSTDIISP